MGISMRQKYSTMSAAEHEQHVINISSENQQVGEKIIRARIQAVHGETVTCQKYRESGMLSIILLVHGQGCQEEIIRVGHKILFCMEMDYADSLSKQIDLYLMFNNLYLS